MEQIKRKQSSIDWLINEHFGRIENCTPNFRKKIEQAKAMHKEEIKLAFGSGKLDAAKHIFNAAESKDSEQYYNETFGGNNEQQ